MPLLSEYITGVRRLLHDANGNYWSDSELTDYINSARYRIVSDTGCNRVLQTNYLIQGVETYAFGSLTGLNLTAGGSGYANGTYALGFSGGGGTGAAGTYTCSGGAVTSLSLTAVGSGYTSAPAIAFPSGGGASAAATAGIVSANTIDVLNITLLWGSMRVPMNYMVFTEFNLKMRAWQTFESRPISFCVYGQNTVYVGPIPDQTYTSEWDTVVMPANLVNSTDADTIVFPFTEPVTFYAAYLAKFKEQSYDEADRFLQTYTAKTMAAVRSSFTRRMPSPFNGLTR